MKKIKVLTLEGNILTLAWVDISNGIEKGEDIKKEYSKATSANVNGPQSIKEEHTEMNIKDQMEEFKEDVDKEEKAKLLKKRKPVKRRSQRTRRSKGSQVPPKKNKNKE